MKSASRLSAALLLLMWAPAAMAAQPLGTVTIMGDSGMSVAIAEIARGYSKSSNVIVNASFANQRDQEAQINDGAAADILITQSQAWIDDLKARGLVDVYSQTNVARNRLALVGPSDSPIIIAPNETFPTNALIRQMGWEPGFVIGHPQMLMEGSYGMEALRNLQALGDMEPYMFYIKRLDEMLKLVSEQKNYGLFFYSTTIGRPDVRVLALLPESTHKPIQYYAVVIAGENMNAARTFLDYLKTSDAKRVLTDNGFSVGD